MFTVAAVAVDKASFHFDKLYSYTAADEIAPLLSAGSRVMVPFGAGNRKRQGVVLGLSERESAAGLKPVSSLLDQKPLLTAELLELVYYLKEHTLCTYYDAVKTILPLAENYMVRFLYSPAKPDDGTVTGPAKEVLAAIAAAGHPIPKEKIGELTGVKDPEVSIQKLLAQGYIARTEETRRRRNDQTELMVKLAIEEGEAGALLESRLSPKAQSVIRLLLETGSASLKEITYFTSVTRAVTDTLCRKGICETFKSRSLIAPKINPADGPAPEIVLTNEQEQVFAGLAALMAEDKRHTALLRGVTGSGKTQIYIKLIQKVIDSGRQAIVLVPEISLTPQLLAIFARQFGDRVAVLHSGLSIGQRADEFERIRGGKADVVVGTRSAIFAPCPELGLIVLDEEQESSYKSESAPRYHAREVARFRTAKHKALLLLGSATPSVESYHLAKEGKYALFELNDRYGGAKLPDVHIADSTEDISAGIEGAVGSYLRTEIARNLENGEQTILLLNRRGYNTIIKCAGCGHTAACPNCAVSLTYHSANDRLMCHYCGYSKPLYTVCPECGSSYVKREGCGTQRAEDELKELFPRARVLRMDMDTTMRKDAHEQYFTAFQKGEYDILLGTQMVAKGLDFPNVTLVGAMSVDQTLFSGSYKSAEKTFSLLTQVAGRSGRGDKNGRACIQTFFPENPIIAMAAAQDYKAFYENEIVNRRVMLYPPFCRLCGLVFSGESEEQAKKAAQSGLDLLTAKVTDKYPNMPIRILSATSAIVPKLAGKYRYKIVIKYSPSLRFRALMKEFCEDFGSDKRYAQISFFADMYYEGEI